MIRLTRHNSLDHYYVAPDQIILVEPYTAHDVNNPGAEVILTARNSSGSSKVLRVSETCEQIACLRKHAMPAGSFEFVYWSKASNSARTVRGHGVTFDKEPGHA